MTRIEVHIDRLVLRGLPGDLTDGIGPLIELRLSELATAERRGDEAPRWAVALSRREHTVTDREGLAAQVARDTWAASRVHVRGGIER